MTDKTPKVAASRITISDVAASAGVSIGTVSRVLNDIRNVKPTLRQRVLDAARELSYAPDSTAQSMRSKRTRVVGVIVPDFRNPLSSAAVSGLEEALTEFGYTMFLANSRYERWREEQILNEFVRRRADGVVAMVAQDEDGGTIRQIEALPMALVLIEREIGQTFDAVRTDQIAGTYRAARYLIALGHRRIGFITVPATSMSGRHRLEGYSRALIDAGLTVDQDLIRMEGYQSRFALEAAYSLLAGRDRPSAIVVSGGMLAGVLEATTQLNLDIPRDLSLVTLGDTELAALMKPPITAIRYDWAETGRAAARLVVERIDGLKSPPQRIIVPYEFMIRSSCATAHPAG